MSRHKELYSNTFLSLGIVCLSGFVVSEVLGLHTIPLIPALAAFFIGCTAVLDRLGTNEQRYE